MIFEDLTERLGRVAVRPDHTPEQALRAQTLTYMSIVAIVAAIAWGVIFAALGHTEPALIPLAYAGLSIANLVYVATTKRYALYRFGQLLSYLVLPFLMQWSLGGFMASGGIMLWAIFAPLGALLFSGTKKALGWFVAFAALLLITGIYDSRFSEHGPHIGHSIRVAFFFMNVGGVYATIFSVLRFFINERDRLTGALVTERDRADELLLNILPPMIAERLKRGEDTIVNAYPEATVLFADIVGFTALAARNSPDQVIALLNTVFGRFDELVDRHGVEKIKTIGDAYMVAAGLPEPRPDHARAIAGIALDMRDTVADICTDDGAPLAVRIGICSGPLVAGVIGRKKFAYDLWGDIVNLASRMETLGESGAIQVTEETYKKLSNAFNFEPHGLVEIEGHGSVATYLLLGRK